MTRLLELLAERVSSGSTFVAYILIFIGVLLAFDGMRQLFYRGETTSETRNRRMRLIADGATAEDVLKLLKKDRDLSRNRFSPIAYLRNLLDAAGVPDMFWRVVLGILFFALVASLVLTRFLQFELAILLGLSVAVLIPVVSLQVIGDQRKKKLITQLPDALDLMSRALRAGHPLSVTVKSVAADMPDPIGSQFGIIEDQVNFGDDITTAFRDFADRTKIEDVHFLSVSVGIQHGTGGNLARVLQILSKVIRDRSTMRKKIKAISSEGRLSSLVLTFLPALIFLSIHTTSPSFYRDVSDDPLFWPFMAAIVALIALQAFILRRLVDIKY